MIMVSASSNEICYEKKGRNFDQKRAHGPVEGGPTTVLNPTGTRNNIGIAGKQTQSKHSASERYIVLAHSSLLIAHSLHLSMTRGTGCLCRITY